MGRRSSPYNTRQSTRKQTMISLNLSTNSSPAVNVRSPSPAASGLPDGWLVEERPSPSVPGLTDKYYYEPGTRKMFRSLVSVKRYLNGDKCYALSKTPKNFQSFSEDYMQIVPSRIRVGSEFKLPDGWIVKEHPRDSNPRHIDRYYFEPRTGYKFRSLISVQKYFNGEDTFEQARQHRRLRTSPANKQMQPRRLKRPSVLNLTNGWVVKEKPHENSIRHSVIDRSSLDSGSPRKRISFKQIDASNFDFSSPPKKIKWVLNNLGGNIWNPFIGTSQVTESEKQLWSEAFVDILCEGV